MTDRVTDLTGRREHYPIQPRVAIARTFSRRTLLGAMLGTTGITVLAACGGTAVTTATTGVARTATAAVALTSTTTAPATAAGVATTASVARTATVAGAAPRATPDSSGRVPSPALDVPDAYLKAPPPFKSVQGVPGRGGRVTVLERVNTAPPTPHDQNRYWQELEKRLGVARFDATLVPGAGYVERLAAVTAGGDLPDLTMVDLNAAPDQYKAIQQGAWADLTPYLTSDALKEFPNLALYPEGVWQNAKIGGKLYGVPRLVDDGPPVLALRQDWANKVGTPKPQNAEEFLRLMTSFIKNDPDGNGQPDTYGLSATATSAFSLGYLQQVFRVPNEWRLEGGKPINAVETEEFRQVVAYMRRLFEAGVYHPNAATMTQVQGLDAIAGSKIGAFQIVRTGLPQPARGLRDRARQANSGGEIVGLVPFGHDGGRGVTYNTPGFSGYVMIPSKVGRDRERVKELLRIIDYLVAPVFSEEQIFLAFGIEGVHYERKPDGTIESNDLLSKEQGELNIIIYTPRALYYPHLPSEALYMQGLIAEQAAIGIDNPVVASYSPTAVAKRAELDQLRIDRIGAIVQGRASLGALDQYVRDWKNRGGDQIRQEYEQALTEQ